MVPKVCIAALSKSQILDIHWCSRHPGIRQAAYFLKHVSSSTTKDVVKLVIILCVEYQLINPAPMGKVKTRCRHLLEPVGN